MISLCLAHLLDKLGTTLRRSRLTQVLFLSRPHQPLISQSVSAVCSGMNFTCIPAAVSVNHVKETNIH